MSKKNINEMKKALMGMKAKPQKRKLTVEGLVLGEDDDYIDNEYNDSDFDDGIDEPYNEMTPEKPQMVDSTSEIKGVIKNIRLQVLNGLAKIAEHPETEEYDTLKRILIICDKPAEQVKKEKNNKN